MSVCRAQLPGNFPECPSAVRRPRGGAHGGHAADRTRRTSFLAASIRSCGLSRRASPGSTASGRKSRPRRTWRYSSSTRSSPACRRRPLLPRRKNCDKLDSASTIEHQTILAESNDVRPVQGGGGIVRTGLNFAIMLLTVGLVGCAVVKVPTPTGGSRADGTIDMSFEYGRLEQPQINWERARMTAASRCRVWGYNGAQEFGGIITRCESAGQYGCNRWFATKKYQCTGKN